MRQDGTFPSGYYYTCSALKGGIPVSTYTLYPKPGYRADSIKVTPLPLMRSSQLMTVFVFEGIDPAVYEVICRSQRPSVDDPTPEIRWQADSAQGA
jgi:hypothetical protein